jgi:rare lipoprotein A
MSRRQVLRAVAGVGAIAAAGGLGLALNSGSVLADDTVYYRVTSAVNLRTGPGTKRRILRVIPAQSIVASLNQSKYGFRKVLHDGTEGWAHADFLEEVDGGSVVVPVPVGHAKTTDDVNFRSGPSTTARVIQVLKAGTTVEVFDVNDNDFRMVGYANTQGWVHNGYLDVGGPLGGYAVTTTALNLREEPNMSSKVLAVMPKGATVFRGDVIANDFLGVTYNGISGWAHTDFLKS